MFKDVSLMKYYKIGDTQTGILERKLDKGKKIQEKGRFFFFKDDSLYFIPDNEIPCGSFTDTIRLENGIDTIGCNAHHTNLRHLTRGCAGFACFNKNNDSKLVLCARSSNNCVFFIPTGRKQSLMSNAFMKDNIVKKTDTVGVGAELELECPDEVRTDWSGRSSESSKMGQELRKLSKLGLIQDIGSDCSVRGWGPEIRFNHPDIKGWGLDRITRVVGKMKELGFVAGETAGQHVHISHPKIQIAIAKSVFGIDKMNEFLTPISCRHTRRYGLGNDILRDQFGEFGTLEIRCWESTTNPDLFRKRLLFSKLLVRTLLRKGVNYENIWTKMPRTMQKLYVDMLFTENEHLFGLSPKTCLSKMGKYAKAYALLKYNFE